MKYINLEENSNWITVTLERPEVRNAFNPEMISEITDVFSQLSRHETARGILLKGEGKTFCAGADLNWMQEMVAYSYEQNIADAGKLWEMFDAVLHCNIPVVAKVHGAAFGGALGLVACADIVLADEKTQFCFSEVKLGIAPAVISAFVQKKITLGKVSQWMLTGAVFDAHQAKEMGLVHVVANETNLENELNKLKSQLCECGPQAVRATKELIHSLGTMTWEEMKAHTTRVISERRISEEGQEGLSSFLQKRTPAWRVNNV